MVVPNWGLDVVVGTGKAEAQEYIFYDIFSFN